MTHELSQVCLNEEQMSFGTESEKFIQRYVNSFLIVFGILGNAVNLTVLLNRSMRNRSNTFLALLAFSDIVFLLLISPNVLANYTVFTVNYYFRLVYLYAKLHLLSFANWASAVAIWCVIAVCAERLLGIRHPMYARCGWPKWRMPALMIAVVGFTGILCAYQHFEYICLTREYCNATQVFGKCFAILDDVWLPTMNNSYSAGFRQKIRASKVLNAIVVVIIPIIVLLSLNAMLLCALHKRDIEITGLLDVKPRSVMDASRHRRERRVTVSVAVIVTSFTLCNGPSAIVVLMRTAFAVAENNTHWYTVGAACNLMVILGKALNFILFCLSSSHFRSRLLSFSIKKYPHTRLRLDSCNKSIRLSSNTTDKSPERSSGAFLGVK